MNAAAAELPGGIDTLIEHILKGPSSWAYETLVAVPNLTPSHREKLIKKAEITIESKNCNKPRLTLAVIGNK